MYILTSLLFRCYCLISPIYSLDQHLKCLLCPIPCPIQPVCCVDLCKEKHLHISGLHNHSAPVFPSSSIMQICDRSPENDGKAWEAVPTSLDSSWLLAVNCECVPDDRAAHLSTALMKHSSSTPLQLWAENNHMWCFVFSANTSATRLYTLTVYVRAHLSSFLCNQFKPTLFSFGTNNNNNKILTSHSGVKGDENKLLVDLCLCCWKTTEFLFFSHPGIKSLSWQLSPSAL